MSRTYSPGKLLTFEANVDLSAAQFTPVKYVAGGSTGPSARIAQAGSGERAHGVLQNKPTQYKGGVVMVDGFTQLKVDGSGTAIVAGDPLKVSTSGVCVKAVTNKDHVIATAAEGADAANVFIEAQITIYDLAV